MEILGRFALNLESTIWPGVIVKYTEGRESWICAYAQIPFEYRPSVDEWDQLMVQQRVTYIGPPQAAWNLERGHVRKTWFGVDWWQRDNPETDTILSAMRAGAERILESRLTYGVAGA